MKLKQVKSENLKRVYDVTVPANDLSVAVDERLKQLSKTVKMAGFRPGKVPLSVVKKQYGQNVLGEVLQNVIDDNTKAAFKKESIKPALQPKIEITDFEEGKDLKFTIECEVMPEVPELDLSKLEIEQQKVEVSDADVTDTLEKFSADVKDFVPLEKQRAAKNGDAVKIDFKGFVGDEAFEGGEAEGHQLELGSNSFIPGFEEQLVGAKAGDAKDVLVSFPEEYHAPHLAGKEAKFEVKVHEVLESKSVGVSDELAQKVGLKDLDALKEAFKGQIQNEADQAVRANTKKDLFDLLESKCEFPVPEQMKQSEFDAIWKQFEAAKAENPDDPEFDKPEKELKAEYEAMAERRVKLGILLAELGEKNKIQVTQAEVNQAVMQEARQYPGQEQKVIEHFQQHPEHIESLKGPILEEKVVDFILQKVKVKEVPVTVKELQDAAEAEAEAAEAKKEPAKKASDSKSGAKKASGSKSSTAKKKGAAKKD